MNIDCLPARAVAADLSAAPSRATFAARAKVEAVQHA
jgi:hypothetical protein